MAGTARALEEALALHRQGKLDEADAFYRKIVASAPRDADALYFYGMLEFQRGRHDAAVPLFERAVSSNAANPLAYFYLGSAMQELRRTDAAIVAYDRAIALKPDLAEAFNNRANALRDVGRLDDARASFDRAIALKPDFLVALYNRGNVLRDLGRFDAALASLDGALTLKPDFAEAHHNRGAVLSELQNHGEALAAYDTALRLRPDLVETSIARGNVLRQLDRPEEAIAAYDRALVLKPDNADVLTARGNAYSELRRPAEALADYERALALAPDQVEALNNHGNALRNLGRVDEALASYGRAIALDPDNADAHANAGWARLIKGDFVTGWREFEWRWRCRQMASQRRDFAQPLWQGDAPLAGKTILLHAEQAIGDTIQFCRYAKKVADTGARVILEVPPPLRRLLEPLAGVDQRVTRGEALPSFDYHCPLLSLPLAFGTDLATIPADPGYIQADAGLAARWAERLGPKSGRRVGLVWSSINLGHHDLSKRSIPLSLLRGLRAEGVRFVSLQKEVLESDRAELTARNDILHIGSDLGDFADTAALIAAMDLVISIDTGVAHLAGAMGKPTWIMLASAPDWRWLLDRDDSPWYPSARLFRQPALADWPSVVTCVAREIGDWLG